MDDTPEDAELPAAKKKSALIPVVVGLVVGLVCAGGAYFAVSSGLVPGFGGAPGDDHATASHGDDAAEGDHAALPAVGFVPVTPIVVSLGPDAPAQHLRFAATLEVPAQHTADVTHLLPRITDALNSFLQALDGHSLSDRDSLLNLRVQMLHRVRLVVGEDRVRDVLVSEFVLN